MLYFIIGKIACAKMFVLAIQDYMDNEHLLKLIHKGLLQSNTLKLCNK